MLGKFFAGSFAWGFFQWFYTAGEGCGFMSFPTLGLEARSSRGGFIAGSSLTSRRRTSVSV